MRLSNTKLLELLALVQNPSDDVNLPDGVSLGQYNNFKSVYKDGTETPLYMVSFMDIANAYSYDVDDTKKALESLQDDEKPLTAGAVVVSEPESLEGKRFVFTSAQNNTDIHAPFLASLQNYCERNNAQLIIGKFTYNKSGFQNSQTSDDGIYYAKELAQYFNEEKLKVCDGLTYCGDLNILPTAKNPLTGFETYTGSDSSIIPHAKIAMESIATPKSESCKMMYATGTVTQHNYIQKKAGQIAQHAHCYGALIVEIDSNGEWFARQIQTDESGIFQDLDIIYTPNNTMETAEILAINWGDIHAEKSDYDVLLACQGLISELKPLNQLFHDLFDMTARNHHNRQSGHFLADMFYNASDSVSDDLTKAKDVLQQLWAGNTSKCFVVESNHDLALEAWLNSNDYDFKRDPLNALTYLELQTYVYKCLEAGSPVRVLDYALFKGENHHNLTFLNTDDSLVIGGVECGYHGHIGANGSRGSPQQFQKLNRAMNTGHTHAASIKGSVYTAGVTGSLDMGYNKGPSSWSHSHIITYPNGFRAILTMKMSGGIYKYSA